MPKHLTEEELRKQAIQALAEKLGLVEGLRFLALVSREPFAYQHWRKEYFPPLQSKRLAWRNPPGAQQEGFLIAHKDASLVT